MSNQTRGGRINRINPLIQKIISSALLRNSDPVLNKATITHVSTSPDLKKSMVFVSTLDGNEGSLKTALEKNRTKISDGAFIGSNTSLVAPIKIGKKAVVGAGSALTKSVKNKSLALTRATQVEIKNYKKR